MSRHVVLLSRDTSLGIALKALLGADDQVTELESAKGWRTLSGPPVDTVVIDLPAGLRQASVDALERRFSGPLLVLLDPEENLGSAAASQRYSVLRRPFGMSELWSLLVATAPAPATEAEAEVGSATEVLPIAEVEVEVVPAAQVVPPAEVEVVPAAQVAPPAEVEALPPAEPPPAWRWRLGRFQSTRKPPQPDELTEPMPAVEVDRNGGGPGPHAAEPAGNDQSPAVTPAAGPTTWAAVDDAPQAVAVRLAERLQADVVALLLDNGQGVLETAGGVGLAPSERRLQVEYGHDVLRELFRVGVGLIDDTERVRGVINGIPFGQANTLMMVPLAYEGHGFGALLAGRYRSRPGSSDAEFTELEIEALMDFAEDVAPALRSAVLLRRLKGQLNLAEGL